MRQGDGKPADSGSGQALLRTDEQLQPPPLPPPCEVRDVFPRAGEPLLEDLTLRLGADRDTDEPVEGGHPGLPHPDAARPQGLEQSRRPGLATEVDGHKVGARGQVPQSEAVAKSRVLLAPAAVVGDDLAQPAVDVEEGGQRARLGHAVHPEVLPELVDVAHDGLRASHAVANAGAGQPVGLGEGPQAHQARVAGGVGVGQDGALGRELGVGLVQQQHAVAGQVPVQQLLDGGA